MSSSASSPLSRDEVLKSGKRLADALFGQAPCAGGSIGGSAEMETPWGKVIVGGYGFLAVYVEAEKTLYNLGQGSAACQNALSRDHASKAEKVARVRNTLLFGSGDDSAVIEKLLELQVPQHIDDMLEGRTQPTAGVVSLYPGDHAWDLQKWGLGQIPGSGAIKYPYRHPEPAPAPR